MFSAHYAEIPADDEYRKAIRWMEILYPPNAHIAFQGGIRRNIVIYLDAPEELLPIADAIYAACGLPKIDPPQLTLTTDGPIKADTR